MDRFLTIVIPVYNTEKYLSACMESVVSQLDDSVEVILVNDGSTDSSGKICDFYADSFDNVFVIHKENGGLSDARNVGLEKAQGNYVMFLDSDDLIASNAINTIKFIAKDNPDIIKMSAKEFFSENELLGVESNLSNNRVYSTGKEALISLISENRMQMCVPFSVYKTQLAKRAPKFMSGLLHEDELWTPQVFLFSGGVIVCDFIFYFYRKGHTSITNSIDKTRGSDDLITVCNALDTVYREIAETKARHTLFNYLCTLYLSAFVDWVLSGKKKMKNKFSRCFPLRHAYKWKNIIKSLIYFASPYLYCIIHRMKGEKRVRDIAKKK